MSGRLISNFSTGRTWLTVEFCRGREQHLAVVVWRRVEATLTSVRLRFFWRVGHACWWGVLRWLRRLMVGTKKPVGLISPTPTLDSSFQRTTYDSPPWLRPNSGSANGTLRNGTMVRVTKVHSSLSLKGKTGCTLTTFMTLSCLASGSTEFGAH